MAKEKSIFDEASSQYGKKNKENKQARGVESKSEVSAPNRYQERETQEIMDKIKQMQEDLQSKVQYIESKSELLGPQLANYLKRNKPLTSEELKFIEKSRGLLGEKIWNLLRGPDKSSTAPPPASPIPPSNRKHKTLGGRKKWMPVK